jgi:hypothetical protein
LVSVSSVVKVFEHVGDEAEAEVAVRVVRQRLAGHGRAEVGAADPEVHDVADAAPRVSLPVPAANPLGEGRHPVENGMDLRHHVLAVHPDRDVARGAQRHVQHGAVLGGIDPLAAEHRVDACAQADALGQLEQQPQGLVGDEVLCVVEVQPHRVERQAFGAPRVSGEEIAEMKLLDLAPVREKRPPRGALRQRGTRGRHRPRAG